MITPTIPAYLEAAQLLLNRCEKPHLRKTLILEFYLSGAVSSADAALLTSANQLETA
jgi:hypothetical protein